MTATYAATFHPEGDWWVIEVPGIGATQTRNLIFAEHMARSLVADMTGAEFGDVTVNLTEVDQ